MKYLVSSLTIFDSKFASYDALDGRAPRPAQAPALSGVAAVGGRGGVVEVAGGGRVVGAAEGLALGESRLLVLASVVQGVLAVG